MEAEHNGSNPISPIDPHMYVCSFRRESKKALLSSDSGTLDDGPVIAVLLVALAVVELDDGLDLHGNVHRQGVRAHGTPRVDAPLPEHLRKQPKTTRRFRYGEVMYHIYFAQPRERANSAATVWGEQKTCLLGGVPEDSLGGRSNTPLGCPKTVLGENITRLSGARRFSKNPRGDPGVLVVLGF